MSRDGVTVPPLNFESYYGRPIIKAPVWRWDIPAYLFTGGLAAGSALIAVGADLTGRSALRRSGRLASLAAVGASTYFLVHDLGRPARFHHMLRVAKPTSPMSVGTWILAVFGPAAGAAAVSEVGPWLPRHGLFGLARRIAPPVGRAAGVVSAAMAPALATYTGVLLADTAVPSWHEAYPWLPFLFSGSALAGAAGLNLVAAPRAEAGPLRRLVVAAAGLELAAGRRVERMGLVSDPYRTGPAGVLLRAGRALLVAGTVGALLGRRSRVVSALSGVALLASSAATRFAVFQAGLTSARDPRYTVLPQRQRLTEAAAAADN
ncbi:polysulfide reductase NrfD [Micromonospora polyrhachis]|uniref:Polysulphide reductase, NrfD n=1 Tax=Micromonospora polyrhachis TaxID=1282883 RepID=A0A7W7SXQ9_9ACTN|nr:NrfD/PsrC family molybdoenzyme membrane anchor subunit [Micromonospora polyrhachis]MBB4962277.1 hypothetical protein [Micromonospora polyrhachis]